MFESFCIPYKKQMSEKISKMNFDGSTFPSLYGYLEKDILELVLPSLVYEINLSRENGTLKGSTTFSRYQFFNDQLPTKEFQTYFLNKFPVAKRLIDQKIDDTFVFLSEIIHAFYRDVAEINQVFKINATRIKDIKFGSGDKHNHGKSVVIVKTDAGPLVYKPHNLDTDVLFKRLMDVINPSLKSKLDHIPVLIRSNYGWSKFITSNMNRKSENPFKIYYRMGALQSLFYILISSDMHYENVLISNNMPYIIDTETLMNSSKSKSIGQENTVTDSIITNSLLSVTSNQGIIDIDFSGVFGGATKSSKIKTIGMENLNTDRVRIVQKYVEQKAHYSNRIVGEITKYYPNFLEGFVDGIKAITVAKPQIIKIINNVNSDLKLRALTRHTLVYAKFLDAANNPQYLTSEEKRLELLKILIKNRKGNTERIENEISTLNYGNVPLYYYKFDQTHLFDEDGVVRKNYFPLSPKESVIQQISTLSQKKVNYQKGLIELCFTSRYNPFFESKKFNSIQSEYLNINIPTDVYKKIKALTAYDPVKKNYDSFFLRLTKDKQFFTGINLSLYEGLGMLLFIYFYEESKKTNYLTNRLLQNFENRFDFTTRPLPDSAFAGLGSLLYFAFVIYERDDKYISQAFIIKILQQLKHLLFIEHSFVADYLTGSYSTIHVLYNIYNRTSNSVIKEHINELLIIYRKKVYEDSKMNDNEIGLAHGLSGKALAIGLLGAHFDDSKLINKAAYFLTLEDRMIFKNKINASWCRGLTGIVCSRLILKNILLKYSYNFEFHLEQYSNELLSYKAFSSAGLCHGYYGMYNILNYFKGDMGVYLSAENKKKLTKILNNKYTVDYDQGLLLGIKNNYQLPTFMLGTSGVAYSLLSKDKKLPNILTLSV